MAVSFTYIAGFFGGLLCVLLVCRLAAFLSKKRGSTPPGGGYDERQQFARGKAYRAAFVVLFAYVAAAGAINSIWNLPWFGSFPSTFIGICLSVGVLTVVCILNDAYLGLKKKPGSLIAAFSIAAIVNIGIGILWLYKGQFFEDGWPGIRAANLVVGILLAVIVAVYAAKLRIDAKSAETE